MPFGSHLRPSCHTPWDSGVFRNVFFVMCHHWLLLASLMWATMTADADSVLSSGGSLLQPYSALKQPRLQLVHSSGDKEATLYLYNMRVTRDPLNVPAHCNVAGGYLKLNENGTWEPVTETTFLDPSEPLIWQPNSLSIGARNAHMDAKKTHGGQGPRIPAGPLQARVMVTVACESEGLLTCTDTLGLGLSSNTLVLRSKNVWNAVVSLKVPTSDLILDILKHQSSYNVVTRLLSVETVDDGAVVVIRVSYYDESVDDDDGLALKTVESFARSLADKYDLSVLYVRSTRHCLRVEEGGFSWPTTPADRVALPLNPCVDTDGEPSPTRRCKGDFLQGIRWEEDWKESGWECKKPDEPTPQRFRNMSEPIHGEGSFGDLLREVTAGPPLTANDITIVSRSLTNFARKFTEAPSSNVNVPPPPIDDLTKIVSTVLDSGRKVIESADKASSSSENLLDAIDKLVSAAATGPSTASSSQPHFSALASPPGHEVCGVAALRLEGPSKGQELVEIPCNASAEDVLAMSPSAAALFLGCSQGRQGIASTLLENDSLFGASDKGMRADSPVLGITLLEGRHETPSDTALTILVLFSTGYEGSCSFWDKERRQWSDEGCAAVPLSELPENVRGCLCTHLTHFAMVITTGPYDDDEESNGPNDPHGEDPWQGLELEEDGENPYKHRADEETLRILSLIACSISLVCLFCIFLVATVYPSWRRGAGKKLQLHMSASLLSLMTAYVAVALLPSPVVPGLPAAICVALGVALHYSLLAVFSWMLVVSLLQALRLNPRSVLNARDRAGTHLVLKACLFGWGIPTFPVIAALCSGGVKIYALRPNTALCYPVGVAFYATVFAPVALTIVVNAFIFAAIMRFVFCYAGVGVRVHRAAKRRVYVRRAFFSLFLFILMGLNWAIGLLLETVKWDATVHTYIAYAFCSTATLQGVSLFLFFVGCERSVSDKITDDLTKFKRRSYDVASRLRQLRASHSSSSDRSRFVPSTPPGPLTKPSTPSFPLTAYSTETGNIK